MGKTVKDANVPAKEVRGNPDAASKAVAIERAIETIDGGDPLIRILELYRGPDPAKDLTRTESLVESDGVNHDPFFMGLDLVAFMSPQLPDRVGGLRSGYKGGRAETRPTAEIEELAASGMASLVPQARAGRIL